MGSPERSAASAEAAVPPSVESDRAKLVYLYLDSSGGATADAAAEALSLPKLAVLGVLRTLGVRDVVEERDGRYHAR